MKIQKTGMFFLLCLSSNIVPWVWAEWTNMCLNLVMQKIKSINLFCLPEWSILIGHYETTGLQYFNLAKSHANNRFYFGVDPIHFTAHPLVCKHCNQKKFDIWTSSDWKLINSGQKCCNSDWSIGCNLFLGPEQTILHPTPIS